MMKASVTVRRGLVIQVEAETQKELFRLCAQAHEVFGESCCGLCASVEIVPKWRTIASGGKTFDYAEMHCQGCHAKLALGMHQTGGTLFPHRKLDAAGKPDNDAGSFGEHNGWTHYRGEKKELANAA